MSFWTWIGLADKQMALKQNEEIVQLKQQLQIIKDERDLIIQKTVEEQTEKYVSVIKEMNEKVLYEMDQKSGVLISSNKALEESREQALYDGFDTIKCKLGESVGLLEKKILQSEENLDNNFSESVRKYLNDINFLTNQISGISEQLKILDNDILEYKQIGTDRISEESALIEKIQENMAQVNDISMLNESLKNLWHVMKVIFVEETLNQIETECINICENDNI